MNQYLLDTDICIYHIKGLYDIDKKIGLKTNLIDQAEPEKSLIFSYFLIYLYHERE
jgi:hypothetical protein